MNNRPFAATLQALLDERDWSQRELERRLEAEFGEHKIGHSTLRLYLTEQMPPTRSAMYRIAKVMRIDPDTFPEHRLEVVRDDLNWRVVGTARALRARAKLSPGGTESRSHARG